jgi:hypothetical protein
MKFQKTLLAAALVVVATAAQAGSFVELPTSGTLRKVGAANQNVDQFIIASGPIIATDLDGFNTYDFPVSFTLLASRVSDVMLGGQVVGDFYDYVFRDSTDNKLVFGSRLTLDDDGEINDIFRGGFTGFSAAAAWAFTNDTDLRMYSAARTSTGLKQGVDVFSPDWVDFRSDLNVEEGNPNTGLYLIKTDAPDFALKEGVVRLWQGGEEGQSQESFFLTGYAPTLAPIPEPSTYAMLLGGLGLLGVIAKRRRSV